MSEFMKCGGLKKFIVFKNEDLAQCPEHIREGVERTGAFIAALRREQWREPHPEYIVINVDEPYIGEIIDVLKRHGHWDTETKCENEEESV